LNKNNRGVICGDAPELGKFARKLVSARLLPTCEAGDEFSKTSLDPNSA
jgi:hypothetical protein